jgi:hypothetical protein
VFVCGLDGAGIVDGCCCSIEAPGCLSLVLAFVCRNRYIYGITSFVFSPRVLVVVLEFEPVLQRPIVPFVEMSEPAPPVLLEAFVSWTQN